MKRLYASPFLLLLELKLDYLLQLAITLVDYIHNDRVMQVMQVTQAGLDKKLKIAIRGLI